MRSAGLGCCAWLVLAILGLGERIALGPIEILFLLAPLVLVPLGMRLVGEPERLRLAGALQPWGAAAAAASFLCPASARAAALAAAWLVVTLLLAVCGLERLRARGLGAAAETAVDAALLFAPVGGGWLVLSRLGASPMGFAEPIVLLTAVHFHYAGFATLLLTGLAGRALGPSAPYRAIVAGAIAGPPLVALGITTAPLVEALAASVVLVTLLSLSVLVLVAVRPRLEPGPARTLLALSAIAPLMAMPLAAAYAWGRALDHPVVALSTLVRIHGASNALGFVLCGVVGWTLARPCTSRLR